MSGTNYALAGASQLRHEVMASEIDTVISDHDSSPSMTSSTISSKASMLNAEMIRIPAIVKPLFHPSQSQRRLRHCRPVQDLRWEVLTRAHLKSAILPSGTKLYLTTGQLHRAMATLARTTMVQNSLRGRHLEYTPSIDEVMSNVECQVIQSCLADCTSGTRSLLSGMDDGVAVLDVRSENTPVKYTSAIRAADSMKPGDSTFIELTSGHEATMKLIVTDQEVCKISMQIIGSAVGEQIEKPECYICIERDVTESIRKAAIAEICRIYGIKQENLCIDTELAMQDEKDDWLNLTDQLLVQVESADAIDTAIRAFPLMDARTCAMQSLILMTELAGIGASHRDVIILDLSEIGPSGRCEVPSVPYVSHDLAKELKTDLERGCAFLETVIRKVYRCKDYNESVTIANGAFECIPLYSDRQSKAQQWAIIINPVACTSLWAYSGL